MSGSGWLSAASLGKRGRPQTPAAAPAVTQTSPAPDPKQPQGSPKAAPAGPASPTPRLRERVALPWCWWRGEWEGDGCSCRGLPGSRVCRGVAHPHTLSWDDCGVPRCRHRNRPPWKEWDLTHALLPPHPHCQHPSATHSQVGSGRIRPRGREEKHPASWQRGRILPSAPHAVPGVPAFVTGSSEGSSHPVGLSPSAVGGDPQPQGTPPAPALVGLLLAEG